MFKTNYLRNVMTLICLLHGSLILVNGQTRSPVVWAGVPDMSMIRVGDTYYVSSATMHMNPGLPIMKSKNLVDWEIASYAYASLGDLDEFELKNGKNTYGGGSCASSLRYHHDKYYVATFSNSSGLNYIYSTNDPNKSDWEIKTFNPIVHDHSLFFDDDGKVYMVTAGGRIGTQELEADLSSFKVGSDRETILEDADAITGKLKGLLAEGAQIFKANGKYYIFLINWPQRGMRTQLLFRADNIMGPYDGKVEMENKGVAQDGFIDRPEGKWYGYFFRDSGAVGCLQYIVPMQWEEGWPVFGDRRVLPMTLDIPAVQPAVPAIVASDEFSRTKGDSDLRQYNHNPDNQSWSVKERKGYLRLKAGQDLRSQCDFIDKKDQANFSYSLDGEKWLPIGTELKMTYTIPHFIGYRFGLFNYATDHVGGQVDFDYFHI